MVFYVLKKSRGKDSRGRVIRDRTFTGFYKFDWMPKNTVNNAASAITNNTKKATNTTTGNYNARRTSTSGTTYAGMTANVWTWLIVGILGVAIVALVLFYGRQRSDNVEHSHIDE